TELVLRLSQPISDPGVLAVDGYRADGRSLRIFARMQWVEVPERGGIYSCLRLVGSSLEAFRELLDLALWEVVEDDHGTTVRLFGEISGRANLLRVAERIGSNVCLDLGGIGWIDQEGLMRWRQFMEVLAAKSRVRLRRVPAPIIREPWPRQRCVVESYYAGHE